MEDYKMENVEKELSIATIDLSNYTDEVWPDLKRYCKWMFVFFWIPFWYAMVNHSVVATVVAVPFGTLLIRHAYFMYKCRCNMVHQENLIASMKKHIKNCKESDG